MPTKTAHTVSCPSLDKEWVQFHALDISLHKEDGPLNDHTKDLKIQAILEALDKDNLKVVAEYARSSDGLINNNLRQRVWPLFLDSVAYKSSTDKSDSVTATLNGLSTNDLPPHKDENQVLLDIRRLFTVLSHFNSISGPNAAASYTAVLSADDIDRLRKRLFSLIVRVLRNHPCLDYYQGYHDIASVVLLVCSDSGSSANDDSLAYSMLEALSLCHLRDYMISDIGLSVNHLKIIPLVAEHADPVLFNLMRYSNSSFIMSNGSYYDYKFYPALLSILTVFSHNLTNFSQLLMLWDFVLSYQSIAVSMYIYLSALQYRKPQILSELNIDPLHAHASNAFAHVESDKIHSLLSPASLFAHVSDHDLVMILKNARSLIADYPLASLDKSSKTFGQWFGNFNKSSVLLNTSTLAPVPKVNILEETSLADLIDQQEMEQHDETVFDSEIFQKMLELDSMAESVTSFEGDVSSSSRMNLLSSSISSLAGASSAINGKLLANGSSALLKHLFSNSSLEKSKNEKPSFLTFLLLNFYRIGITVGLLGFLVHYLLKNSDSNMKLYVMDRVRPFLLTACLSDILATLRQTALAATRELGLRAGQVVQFATSYHDVNTGIDVTQVGLGRDVVQGFGR